MCVRMCVPVQNQKCVTLKFFSCFVFGFFCADIFPPHCIQFLFFFTLSLFYIQVILEMTTYNHFLLFCLQLYGNALCSPGPWPYYEKEEIKLSHYCILILPATSWPQGRICFSLYYVEMHIVTFIFNSSSFFLLAHF